MPYLETVPGLSLDNLEDGYYEVNLRGEFTQVNDALCRILSMTKADMLGDGSSFRAFTDDENADKTERAFNHVYKTGQPLRALEGKAFLADGSQIYLELSVSLLNNEHGDPVGFHGIVRDVTDRKAVEEALAQRMVFLSVLQQVDLELNQTLELEKVLVVALNAVMLLSYASNSFIALIDGGVLRIARQANLPHTTFELPLEHGIIGRALRTERAQFVRDVALDPDYISDTADTQAEIAIPLHTHNKLLGVLNLETNDMTRFTDEVFEYMQLLSARIASAIENARLYEQSQAHLSELRDLYTQLSGLEQLKTDMIRIASHDLRTPLGIIVGYLDILAFDLDPILNGEQRQYMDAMRRSAERIQRMSTEILSLERVNALRNQPRQPLPMADLVSKVIIDHRDSARQKGVNLISDLAMNPPLMVLADLTSLPEAVDNLIGNAIKYTAEDGFVTVRLQPEGADYLRFEVVDTGIGIRDEHQTRLFEPFYRVKSDETIKIDGTGLGLYLVKRIIDQHNGEMYFHSIHGEGSTFGFLLPLVSEEVIASL